MTDLRSIPPNPDEAEVSIFGPGVGECVVVHLGGGAWYLTSIPGGKRARRASDVAKQIRQMTREMREVSRKSGQVRVRCKPGCEPEIEAFDGAYRVKTPDGG